MQSTATAEATGLGAKEIHSLLADTARQVKVMKASWLRVAINLKKIRDAELWRHVQPACENFEDYVFGVLNLNRAVVRRMLQAMDYTNERRPSFVEEFQQRGEEMDVPSYDAVNQLRRAESSFEGRESEFESLEAGVFEQGVGRVTLKKQINEMLGEDDVPSDAGPAEPVESEKPPSIEEVLRRLKDIERVMLKLSVSKEARKLMFDLVETLEKEK
jgi:hypothetical protein